MISSYLYDSNQGFFDYNPDNNKININNTQPLLNKNDIEIKLFDPVIVFRGNVNESVGSVLRGEIILTLNKPTKITCIELKFSGKTKIFCLNAFGTVDKYNEEIISQNINFLSHSTSLIPSSSTPSSSASPSSSSSTSSSSSFPIKLFSKPLFSSRNKKKFLTFSSGIHKLSFEYHIPGSLPESITTEFGLIKYKLKFKIDYITTFYSKTLSSVRNVEIIRIILPDYINYIGIELSRNFNQIINYQLSIPKKSYFLDESIPVNLKIIPLINHFKLHSIECLLAQKITFMKDNDTESIQYSNNNDNFQFDENDEKENIENEIGNLIYEKSMIFELPKCNDINIHHSVETPLIRIKHELKFCFLVSIPNNDHRKKKSNHIIKSKLSFNVGINLLSCSVKNDVISLPNYDDDSFYCPSHPEYKRIAWGFI
ncbi:hypothetical protein C1645_823018 [Glomus cerebriforme]|uniref:Arrestin C-terminal-like domain-containing protein n=1 Tax=Glomus cerebriforme TaxID=658196 RepID=A0A397SYJ3_9GLOM|nr:hypothetical protein C1645_823018 [Glomus cerebriforme]